MQVKSRREKRIQKKEEEEEEEAYGLMSKNSDADRE